MGMERRGYIDQPYELINQRWEESVNKEKPLGRIARREPNLFAHWQMGMRPAAGQ